jgi:hypothetical protein
VIRSTQATDRRVAKGAIAWMSAVVLACSTGARADGSSVAEELFREGKALMAAGRVEEACTKLEESQRLDPGSGTLVNLAVCFEKLGKLARAWAAFEKVPSLARRDGRPDREDFARSHITDIEPRLSWLTIVVLPAVVTPGLEVSLDGVTLGSGGWNTALPIDPGQHHVAATAAGRIPWHTDVEIGAGPDREQTAIPLLRKDDLPPVAAAPVISIDQTLPKNHDASGRITPGLVVGGVGVVVLTAGAVFGILAITTNHEASEACHGETSCAPGSPGPSESRRAVVDATLADVGIGLGAVASAAGLYLVLSGRQPPNSALRAGTSRIQIAPRVDPGGGGLSVTGLW